MEGKMDQAKLLLPSWAEEGLRESPQQPDKVYITPILHVKKLKHRETKGV